jgi:hypothetical protein
MTQSQKGKKEKRKRIREDVDIRTGKESEYYK